MTTDLRFKHLTKAPHNEGLKEIKGLYQEAGWWESHDSLSKLKLIIQNSFTFLIVQKNSELIGMGRALSDGCADAYLHDIFVHPHYRKHGIGHQIVQHLTDYCLSQGVNWIALIATPGSASFYQKLHFQSLDDFTPMILNDR